MKKLNICFTAGLSIFMVITSCKKLDLYPYSAIEVSQAFKTVKDASSWDVGVFASFRARQYGSYMYYGDVQGDQLNASLDFGNRNGAPHRWDFQSDDQTLSPMWAAYYSLIADVNVAINGFKTITPTSTADAASLSQYTGDMYLTRAYCFHKLITRWAKPYEAATAATDPGVPLVVTYDLFALPDRSNVKAVYAQILSDISTAETLLANVSGAQGKPIFSIDAARALEARVKLYMHDYTGAYAAATTLTSSGKYPLITTQAALNAYWYTDGTTESIMQMAASNTDLPNANSIYLGLVSATGKYDPDFIPTQDIYNLFPVGDLRKTTYFDPKICVISGATYPSIYLVNKYPGNPTLFTGATTNYEQQPKVFRIAEQYLIAAEAAIGLSNEPNALTALNALRVARGETAITATGAALVQAVRDERTRELAFEGFRIDDLTRWHLGFTRGTPQNLNCINVGPLYNLMTQPVDAPKFVWGLPTNDYTVNPNLRPQNPGW